MTQKLILLSNENIKYKISQKRQKKRNFDFSFQ